MSDTTDTTTEPPIEVDPAVRASHLAEYSNEVADYVERRIAESNAALKKEIMDALNVRVLMFDKDMKPIGVRNAILPNE